MSDYDVIVIGGGPAGLAAACKAKEEGAERVLVIERDKEPGGILNQCIHNGFGLHYFKEELTGPEYAGRFIKLAHELGVEICLDTMVLEITQDKEVYCVNPIQGCHMLKAGSIVLSMGCRERTRGAVCIPGDRPAGVYTAGTAQRYVNIEGWMAGKRVVILGSGDIGLIMARRLALEGAKVLACVELMPYSNGLSRNIEQCLNDFHIPLYLSHTITQIIGKERVEKVVVSEVGEDRKPVPGTEMELECDTLLLSIGLIPENELSRSAGIPMDDRTNGALVYEDMQTMVPGIFACRNVVHVHDLVDFVTAESQRAGSAAARYAAESCAAPDGGVLSVKTGEGVTYTVPQRIRRRELPQSVDLFFRVKRIYDDVQVMVMDGNRVICSYNGEHMAPGEMEKITVPGKLISRITGRGITVTLRRKETV